MAANGADQPAGLSQHACPGGDPQALLDSDAGEAIAHSFSAVQFFVGQRALGEGVLLITTRRLLWQSSSQSSTVHSVQVQLIALHAISSDTPVPGQAGLYLQLAVAEHGDPDDEDGAEDAADDELYLIPEAASKVQEMFQALCEAAALNPDSMSEEDEDREPELFFDEREVLAGADADTRASMLQHFDGLLAEPRPDPVDQLISGDPDRFEDAGEGDEDENMDEAHPHHA